MKRLNRKYLDDGLNLKGEMCSGQCVGSAYFNIVPKVQDGRKDKPIGPGASMLFRH